MRARKKRVACILNELSGKEGQKKRNPLLSKFRAAIYLSIWTNTLSTDDEVPGVCVSRYEPPPLNGELYAFQVLIPRSRVMGISMPHHPPVDHPGVSAQPRAAVSSLYQLLC